MDKRLSWEEYFMELATLVAKRSTCIRRKVGSVLTKDNHILSTGYNGSPAGIKHCISEKDLHTVDFTNQYHICFREKNNIPSGEQLDRCYGIHSECNCIIQAARNGTSTIDSVLYCTTKPCIICLKILINAGVKEIIYHEDYNDSLSDQLMQECNILFKKVY